jgi:hypothetical protein
MNIVVGDDNLKLIDEKYTVLPLDSFRYNQTVKTAYAVLENIPIQEMNQIDYYKRLHIDLIKFYGEKRWDDCLFLLDALTGRWNKEIDTFYTSLQSRVIELKDKNLDDTWSPLLASKVKLD